MLRWFVPALLTIACGSSDTDVAPPPSSHTEGRILGTVSTFGEDDQLHVVAGARVTANGLSSVTDSFGRFLFDGIPTDAPMSIMIQGPDDARGERYAENRVIVTVPSDSGVITPDLHLLRACTFELDGVAGTSMPVGCGGDDRASFIFSAGSIASRNVLATVAALDPVHVADRLGLPQGTSEGTVSILGGVSVELTDAIDGRPLQIAGGASVQVRFELAPSDAAEGEIELEWFDEGSGNWLTQPRGRVVMEGERTFYEFDAMHFSRYRAVRVIPLPPNACITLSPTICGEAGCERSVWISIVDLTNQRTMRGQYGPSSICIPAWSSHAYDLYFAYQDPASDLSPSAPSFHTSRRVITPASNRYGHECIADCTNVGVVQLAEFTPGCVTGTLMTACGLDCTEPYAGPLDVSHDGRRFASVDLAPECGGDVCIPIPIASLAPGSIELRTATGHRLTFAPDPASRGAVCDDACTPSTNCQELGTSLLACGVGLGDCLEANFTSSVLPNAPACSATPEQPHLLNLDASATIGRAAGYSWKVYRLDDQGATQIDSRAESWGRTQFCLPKGSYRVTLTANTNTTFNLPFHSSVSQDVDVAVGLIELSISASPGTRVAPGMQVTLSVVMAEDPSQYTFTWWRAMDENFFVGEGTSVTINPTRASQMFGVWAARNGARVGEAQILIEVD